MTGGPWRPPYSPVEDDPKSLATVIYNNLRCDCVELEELIEHATAAGTLTEKELKRLDKAVTVMKVGFKIVKKVLKHERSRAALNAGENK